MRPPACGPGRGRDSPRAARRGGRSPAAALRARERRQPLVRAAQRGQARGDARAFERDGARSACTTARPRGRVHESFAPDAPSSSSLSPARLLESNPRLIVTRSATSAASPARPYVGTELTARGRRMRSARARRTGPPVAAPGQFAYDAAACTALSRQCSRSGSGSAPAAVNTWMCRLQESVAGFSDWSLPVYSQSGQIGHRMGAGIYSSTRARTASCAAHPGEAPLAGAGSDGWPSRRARRSALDADRPDREPEEVDTASPRLRPTRRRSTSPSRRSAAHSGDAPLARRARCSLTSTRSRAVRSASSTSFPRAGVVSGGVLRIGRRAAQVHASAHALGEHNREVWGGARGPRRRRARRAARTGGDLT